LVYRTSSQSQWQTIWQRGGANLEVFGTEVWFWYNQNAAISWINQYVDLSFLAGESCVEFAFANKGYYGNHIWIDNVNLDGEFLNTPELSSLNLNAFPNPSNGNYTVQSNKPIDRYRVVDISGQEVLAEETIGSKQLQVSIESEAKGIYFLHVYAGANEKVIKLIKN
jgi:hypothetical protein